MKPEEERLITDREKASRRVSYLPGVLHAHTCWRTFGAHLPSLLRSARGVRGGDFSARGLLENTLQKGRANNWFSVTV